MFLELGKFSHEPSKNALPQLFIQMFSGMNSIHHLIPTCRQRLGERLFERCDAVSVVFVFTSLLRLSEDGAVSKSVEKRISPV